MAGKAYRLGCDIGGTFTDFVLLNDQTGEIKTDKCLTTPKDPSDAVEQGIREMEKTTPGFVEKLDEVDSRNNPGHQFDYREKGGQNRSDHHEGFQGRPGNREGDPLCALRCLR